VTTTLDVVRFTIGAELPDVTFDWRDRLGALIQFGTIPHTFRFIIDTPTPFVKTTLITFADTSPNVTVGFAANELDTLVPGIFGGELWAKRTSDSKDREPLQFDAVVRAAYA